MRLWHYKLIPYLPKSQILSQWRELNSIFKKQDKHILINYIYEYPKMDLYLYSEEIIYEMVARGFKVNLNEFYYSYFEKIIHDDEKPYKEPFKNHHTNRYLLQCFYNLQEKFDRGQKDFSKELYKNLENFINSSNVN